MVYSLNFPMCSIIISQTNILNNLMDSFTVYKIQSGSYTFEYQERPVGGNDVANPLIFS